MMNEEERLEACREIAIRMYVAGMGDCFDAIERLTHPRIDLKQAMSLLGGDIVVGIASGIRANRHRSRITAWRRAQKRSMKHA